MKQDLRQALKERTLTGDGAMGTYLYQLGLPVGISYEELNITQPEVIADVHRRYYEAGARLIETNTYTANREKLSKFGLEQDVAAINRAGVELARKAVGSDAYVVGAIGSIRSGRRRSIVNEQLENDFREQMTALLDAGADGLLLETFYDHDEMLAALRIARSLTQLPVICQFVTEDSGVTRDGVQLDTAFAQLAGEGADVVGFNCHSGPNGILRALEKLTPIPGVPFSVYPNAGLPKLVDGRYTYSAPPEYFGSMAGRFAALGARIIGGCCGTTPDHVAAIAQALAAGVPAAPVQESAAETASPQAEPAVPAEVSAEPNAEAAPQPCVCGDEHDDELSLVELAKTRHTVIVEFDSPRGLSVEKFMKGAAALRDAGVDAISMADNSLAQTRMSNVSTGYLVKEKLGVRPLLHIACRDRNSIGTQSHLMGLHALDIDHVLAITGDPARVGDLPGASSVYDMTSFDLIRMTKQLNDGLAFSGKQLKEKAKFVVGSAFDPNVKYLEKAVQRMEKKIEAGADYFMTQPVYDLAIVEKLYNMTKHISAPIYIGIMPLISGRNAEYLHNEVPGIRIAEATRKRMAGLEGEEGRRAGVEIAKELIDEIIPYFKGIYLMTPMMFYEMTAELTQYIWEKTGAKRISSCP
ncbi:bifunctional homocysteine S-methyltransferase/methylenetetrahydrofolate reductase [Paenibacillus sp. MBLB4367]|uniref:bifunctional homocysteine S-methyltransferase/methylenetetrahydrofolate reductase n=1 Tax=Paenibacillus sp. MBLB4367 TaxID=3384767 RepID=UPI003907F519